MVLLKNQLSVDSGSLCGIDKFDNFVVLLYALLMFTAPLAAEAAVNNLVPFKKRATLQTHRNVWNSDKTCSKAHTWYLTEELISLVLCSYSMENDKKYLLPYKLY